jgi:hypothetical protein
MYYTHPRCPHRRIVSTVRQEATSVISELITVLASGVISPPAPELLLVQFSG